MRFRLPILTSLIFLLALNVAGPVFAQSTHALLVHVDYQGGAQTPGVQAQNQALLDSLFQDLLASQRVRMVIEHEGAAPTGDELARAARERGCDLWITIRVTVGTSRWSVQYELVEVLLRQVLAKGSYEAEAPALLSMVAGFWSPVVDALGTGLLGKVEEPRLIVVALPGTEVEGLGETVVMPAEGRYETTVAPGTITLTGNLAGYYQATQQIFARPGENTATLHQERLRAYSVDLGLWGGSFPSLGFSWHFLRDRLYLKTELISYLLGIYLGRPENTPDDSIFVHRSLVQWGITGGGYLYESEDPLRPYAGLGLSLRIIVAANGYTGLEPIVPLVPYMNLGVEYAPFQSFRLYLEWVPQLYWPTDKIYFLASQGSTSKDDQLPTLGENLFLDLRVIRVGARLSL